MGSFFPTSRRRVFFLHAKLGTHPGLPFRECQPLAVTNSTQIFTFSEKKNMKLKTFWSLRGASSTLPLDPPLKIINQQLISYTICKFCCTYWFVGMNLFISEDIRDMCFSFSHGFKLCMKNHDECYILGKCCIFSGKC